ncbi:hypothetical protein ACFQ0B_14300 [Nonomuraea thailandensis]
MATYHHPIGDYVRAALRAGLRVRRCEEPAMQAPAPPVPRATPPDGPTAPGPWELWPWVLVELAPEAARAAVEGVPAIVVWHFQLAP